MTDYRSAYTGAQLDTAVGKVLNGELGTYELTLVEDSSIYTLQLDGVTQTFEDITDLISAGTAFVFVNNDGDTLLPSYISDSSVKFSNLYAETAGFSLSVVSINSSDTVTLNNYSVESQGNKVTSISDSSTDTQYPSAKCVYTLVGNVEALLNDINSGN